MGADYLATGHYANVVNQISSGGDCYLEKGEDVLKDQSYFLAMLSRAQLEKIIFPLAKMNKKSVKQFAESKNLKPISCNYLLQDIFACNIHLRMGMCKIPHE